MPYSVDYFNRRVLDEVESWPIGILAGYARLVELLIEFGPDLRMPDSRAMGSSSCAPVDGKASGERFIALWRGGGS